MHARWLKRKIFLTTLVRVAFLARRPVSFRSWLAALSPDSALSLKDS
jgi:hypothetical protein